MKRYEVSMDLFILGELMTADETIASYVTTDNMYITYHLIIAKDSDDIVRPGRYPAQTYRSRKRRRYPGDYGSNKSGVR